MLHMETHQNQSELYCLVVVLKELLMQVFLQFLTEKGIHPSCIAGTSAGAIVGGLFAFGKTPEEILEFFKSIYFFIGNILLQKAGLIDWNPFKSYFAEILGDVTIW